jgi:hypothetical protein
MGRRAGWNGRRRKEGESASLARANHREEVERLRCIGVSTNLTWCVAVAMYGYSMVMVRATAPSSLRPSPLPPSRIRVLPNHFPPPSSLLSRHVDVLPRPALETVETPVVSSLLVQTPAGLESTPPLRALPRARLHLESRPYSRPDSVEQERHKRSLHLDRLVSGRCLGHVGG